MSVAPDLTLPLWAKAIAQPAQEFAATALPLISGHIPPGLRGSLYRNGPGRLQRAGQPVPHWFDGDGAILAVHFRDEGAIGLYRYVQTAGLQAESQVDRYLYAGYGQLAAGPFWKRWQAHPKNVANTAVLPLPDKLLALWEGGLPHALDPDTLETYGLDSLGELSPGQTYSAHPKRDPLSGEIYNFGLTYGKKANLHLYHSDASGSICQHATLPLDRSSLLHDFAIAGPYLIFLIPPLQMQLLPVLLGLKSFSDSLQWRPELGTQIWIVDRQSLQPIQRFETEPWFQWHIAHSYVEADGEIVINFVRYPDWSTNRWLAEVVTGHPRTVTQGLLWQIRLDPQHPKLLGNQELMPLYCDFPQVAANTIGQKSPDIYVCSHSCPEPSPAEMFDSLAHFNLQTGTMELTPLNSGQYPMEPILADDRLNPEQTWLLTVVFDGHQNQSTLQIFDADHLATGPVAVLALPQVIPFGFHGTWRSQ